MPSGGAVVEVEIFTAVKFAEAFRRVFHAMAMDYVHDYGYALAVGVVHQSLEFLRRAKTGAEGKEVGHLVAEGAVIRMLLQGHNLDGVIAKLLDAGKDFRAEFFKRTNFFLLRGHADMALID